LIFKRKEASGTDSLTIFFGMSTNEHLYYYSNPDPFGKYRPEFILKPYMTLMDGLMYDTTEIVVGAYKHRSPSKELWESSSRGPNFFGQIKPDIVAPGYDVYSLVPSGGTFPDSIHMLARGTSFAAPFVAGVVALMLQQNPDLDQEDIRQILQNTAIRDSVTGLSPNNDYGWGRLNFQALCDYLVGTEKPSPGETGNPALLCRNYPNPFNPETRIFYQMNKTEEGVITLFNPSGRLISKKQVKGNGSFVWSASGYGSGIYFCRLKAGNKIFTRKMILAR
jgi:hypothetical protein